MFIVKNRKIFYILSVLLLAFSVYSMSVYGLNFGIDFKGGSIVEVNYSTASVGTTATSTAGTTSTQASAQTTDGIKGKLAELGLGESSVIKAGDNGFIIRTKALTDAERKTVTEKLTTETVVTGAGYNTATTTTTIGEIKRFDSVGPVLGKELQGKATWSIVLVLLAIVLFITFVFRKVSQPVSSWKYGIVAIVALLHDVIIPSGIFAYLGRNGGYEIDALFITAILVILGFSIHDTIVVFDRTRENLRTVGVGSNSGSGKRTFEDIVGMSVSQTIARSINTSLTTVLALIVLFVLGPSSTHNFALALIIGIITGTYSSIFIGSPLLVTWQKFSAKTK